MQDILVLDDVVRKLHSSPRSLQETIYIEDNMKLIDGLERIPAHLRCPSSAIVFLERSPSLGPLQLTAADTFNNVQHKIVR
jgi:hypothetical protein